MSRSYKRVPCCKDHNKGAKKYANRYVRRNHVAVPSGMAYHFPLKRKRLLNIGIEIIMGNIQIKNYIGCGINITK